MALVRLEVWSKSVGPEQDASSGLIAAMEGRTEQLKADELAHCCSWEWIAQGSASLWWKGTGLRSAVQCSVQ